MFRFKFVIDKFQKSGARGPILTPNVRAKWLTRLCPNDIEIAFAPSTGQIPMYDPDKIKIVKKEEPGWWNHYFFIKYMHSLNDVGWSLGPNIDLRRNIKEIVPLVANSNFHKYERILTQWNHYPEEMVHVIPNIIDPEYFYPGGKKKEIKVGWIGYDVDQRNVKGVEVIPYLAKKFPDVKFEMVLAIRPKRMKSWLKEELPNLKIMSEVPHYKMADIIRSWHVLVSGTKSETGATHIKEALACGVPVIAAEVGCIPEFAKNQYLLSDMKLKKNSHDWSQESLERFAEALDTVLSDSTIYNILVKGAIEDSQEADPHVVCQKWFDFIYKCKELA